MKTFIYKGIGIPDKKFTRGKIPMTKEEVRAVTLSKLKLTKQDSCVDIGAGTGSISIEMGFCSKNVFAIECKPEGIALIKQNIEAFGLDNIELIEGMAPDCMQTIGSVDKIFIGGTRGNINSIFDWVERHLNRDGRIVANFITLENTVEYIQQLKERQYKNIDITQMAISKGRAIGGLTMMDGNNPIYIICATKG